jgi:hypothetical protein
MPDAMHKAGRRTGPAPELMVIGIDMDGQVLTQALKDQYWARYPATFRQAGNGDSTRDRVYSDEDGRKVEERLRSLGYLE